MFAWVLEEGRFAVPLPVSNGFFFFLMAFTYTRERSEEVGSVSRLSQHMPMSLRGLFLPGSCPRGLH